jgi:predicted TIM-barrel fold metal-dependent hydrolase
MLIDFHTHCFPELIAEKAIPKLSYISGGLEPYTDGTVSGLKEAMHNADISASVVLNIATNAHQQRKVNDFAISINDNESIFSFGSVHFESPDVFEELERIKASGLKGVKLHPDYQGFEADDPKMKPIYKKISSLGLITVFHAGRDYGFEPPYKNTPEKMLKAFSWFSSPVIAAHWGGVDCYMDTLKLLAGTDIYFDTSFGYSMMPKYFAQKIFEKHGADKMLFGTDTPWHNASMELRLINSLDISDDDKQKIFYKNAKKLLQI